MDIPQSGFGTYRLKEDTISSVILSLQNGNRHIDTAPLYKNEKEVGIAIQNSGIDRRHIFVTTKISRDKLKSNSIAESITHSLYTMNLDYIDLVLLHEPIDYINNWKLLNSFFLTEGKNRIRHIGVSNYNTQHLSAISDIKIPYCNQIEINPFLHRDNIQTHCNLNNIKIVAHSPLAKGEKLQHPLLVDISKKVNKTPAQLMLKWNQNQKHIIIPRSKNKQHILENMTLDFDVGAEEQCVLDSLDIQYATHPKYIK
jgi:diketogulonate reductase-like aldo/keto reductase